MPNVNVCGYTVAIQSQKTHLCAGCYGSLGLALYCPPKTLMACEQSVLSNLQKVVVGSLKKILEFQRTNDIVQSVSKCSWAFTKKKGFIS